MTIQRIRSTSWLTRLALVLLLMISVCCHAAEKGGLGDESWTVSERDGRAFYLTHGTIIRGHEFGFFKNPGDSETDRLWLSFTAGSEEIKNFEGKEAIISLDVDGEEFKIRACVHSAFSMGVTHIMLFARYVLEEQLLNALMKGRYLTVCVTEPAGLEALLDIKEDTFGLEGFAGSREEAAALCEKLPPLIMKNPEKQPARDTNKLAMIHEAEK